MTKKKAQVEDWMPKCESCAFFDCEPKEDIGVCRRYPPIVVPAGDDDFDSVMPITSRTDWCGEFTRKTN